jgi:hypothetical protein
MWAQPRSTDARLGLTRCTGELEREPGARPAPGDVVVQVPVEPLEARIEVRCERDQQQLDVI